MLQTGMSDFAVFFFFLWQIFYSLFYLSTVNRLAWLIGRQDVMVVIVTFSFRLPVTTCVSKLAWLILHRLAWFFCGVDEAQHGTRNFGRAVQWCQSYKLHGYFVDRVVVHLSVTTVIIQICT